MNASLAYAVANTTLEIERSFNAPLPRLWDAWTQPGLLAHWFGPDACSVTEATVALEVGGQFSITLNMDSGEVHQVCGRYTAVEPQRRLAFTWYWASTPERESRVEVEFRAAGNGSKVKIHHDRFNDHPTTQRHAQGWLSSLNKLDAALARAQ